MSKAYDDAHWIMEGKNRSRTLISRYRTNLNNWSKPGNKVPIYFLRVDPKFLVVYLCDKEVEGQNAVLYTRAIPNEQELQQFMSEAKKVFESNEINAPLDTIKHEGCK